MRLRAAGLGLALLCASGSAAAFPVNVLQNAGPSERRFNVAILGDGYRASDQAKLTSDAKQLIEDVFAVAPYKSYRQLFNFKVVQSVSVDQGAKGGQAGGTPNTLFKAYYNCSNVPQLVCFDDGAVLSAAAADVPEFDLALLLVNDAKYGGSGGDVPCVSTHEDAAEILRHELGHNIANLADEYESPYPGYPTCDSVKDCSEPNATLRSTRAAIKWLDWLDTTTPVPTPKTGSFDGVGVFEGGRYLSTGMYRPMREHCKMRSLGEPFCPVCGEALVRSFWNLPNVHLIDQAQPTGVVSGTPCSTTELSVTSPAISPPSLGYSWTIDGKLRAAATSAKLALSGLGLSDGLHQIVVTVRDTTQLVRSDPQNLLSEQHTWQLDLGECPADAGPPPNNGGNGGSSAVAASASAGTAGALAGASGASAGRAGDTSRAGSGDSDQDPPPPEHSAACGCHLESTRSSAAGAGVLALVLASAVLRRRRRA